MAEVVKFKPRKQESLLAAVVRLWQEAVPEQDMLAICSRRFPGLTRADLDRALDDAEPYILKGRSSVYGGGGGEAA